MTDPWLSIVIPSFRKAEVIREAVEAIIVEALSLGIKFEVIVVVDGDVDGTSTVLNSLDINELSFLISAENFGKSHAIKLGVAKALNLKYCALLDADLDLSPRWLRNAIEILESDESVDVVLGSKFHPDSIINYSYFRGALRPVVLYARKTLSRYPRLVVRAFDD